MFTSRDLYTATVQVTGNAVSVVDSSTDGTLISQLPHYRSTSQDDRATRTE